ncbi:hypothetical protein POM88_048684 [Heracleum sosnowskyi]|uniref:Uncharacterized protein n=1 Tax=Heracleum sosnowskyi TaxID=360622 RepID=A0AAD8M0X8_9APIA|nr:hypothetical protein POM88_048684 [Heracleum sosnowskyi]
MASSQVRVPLKLLIHKQEERVLNAEADSDFFDILFSLLTMPMGTIVRILSKHSNTSQPPAVGSFNNLYGSIANLDAKFLATEACKVMLLNTRNSAEAECQKLKINIDDIEPVEFFTCENLSCTKNNMVAYVSNYSCVQCRKCSRFLNKKAYFTAATVENRQGVFVPQTTSFVITHDLSVLPNIPASILAMLKKSGITDFGALEERTLNLGI